MAECSACSTKLEGSWGLSGNSKTGRNLGITNGYFICGNDGALISCYCSICYKREVIKLAMKFKGQELLQHFSVCAAVSDLIGQATKLKDEITKLKKDTTTIQREQRYLQEQNTLLTNITTTLHTQIREETDNLAQQKQETNNLQQKKIALNNEISTFQHQMRQLESEVSSLQKRKVALMEGILITSISF
jgi:hypothetical protein